MSNLFKAFEKNKKEEQKKQKKAYSKKKYYFFSIINFIVKGFLFLFLFMFSSIGATLIFNKELRDYLLQIFLNNI